MPARTALQWMIFASTVTTIAGCAAIGAALAADVPASRFDAAPLIARAESGDQTAAFQLGTLYYTGIGVFQDYLAAVKWLTKSANAGNADAACELGMLYQSGSYADTPPVDPAQAAHWYGEAATHGNGCGAFGLAALYRDGEGLTKDPAKADQLFAQASPLGFTVDATTFPLEQINRHFHAVAVSVAGQAD
jgi:TPR repeat protein